MTAVARSRCLRTCTIFWSLLASAPAVAHAEEAVSCAEIDKRLEAVRKASSTGPAAPNAHACEKLQLQKNRSSGEFAPAAESTPDQLEAHRPRALLRRGVIVERTLAGFHRREGFQRHRTDHVSVEAGSWLPGGQ